MKKILQNLVIACFLFTACNFCKGVLITVESYTDSNGFFRYTVNKGDEPFLFGGGSNLCFQVQSYNVITVNNPPGWQPAISASEIISWKFTNQNVTTIDSTIQFSVQSDINDFVNYNQMEPNINYPLGIIFGDVYNTNKTLYSPYGSSSTNYFTTSINVAGYERFEFLGPAIPEPFLCFAGIIGIIQLIRLLKYNR